MRETLTPQEYRSRIGQELGVSDWILVDQDKIQRFADLTQDWNPIHLDPEAGRAAGLGGTIAHGFLTIALIAGLAPTGLPAMSGVTVGFNYGFNKIRLLAPVSAGKRIRGRFKLKDCVERAPGEWQLRFDLTVEIEGTEKPALIAEWLILNRVG